MDHAGHDMGHMTSMASMAATSMAAMHESMTSAMSGMGHHMASATASAMSAASTAAAAASEHAGHSMGGMGGNACKIQMLWNWNTVDACFLSRSWHVTSKGMFAGSVFGVFFLCMAIEAWRRLAREFDRRIASVAAVKRTRSEKGLVGSSGGIRAMYIHHVVRSLLYGVQFAGAFIVMLLGMYYNGFILIAIFLGHTIGYLVFGRDTLVPEQLTESGCCC